MIAIRRTWNESRVDCCDPNGAILTLSVAWTSLAEVDPYTVVNDGRAPFRVKELLEVVALLAGGRATSQDIDGIGEGADV